LPSGAESWLTASLALFFASAIAALATNLPLSYQAAEPDAIRSRLREDPPWVIDAAERDIALTRVKALRSAKKKNSFKGLALICALGFEALAVGCVAAAVTIIL
jgi:hypothetical protein